MPSPTVPMGAEPIPVDPRESFANSPAQAVYQDALAARGRGQDDYAIELLRQAVSLDEEHTLAWEQLFDMTRDGDDPALAAEACAGLLEHRAMRGHEAAERDLQCAVAHQRAGLLEAAETYAWASLARAEGRLEPLITLTGILLEEHQGDDVISLLEGAIRTPGGELEASALNHLGAAYRLVGRNGEAVATIQQARELSPNRVDILVNLGGALEATGQDAEAERVFHRVLDLDPDNPAALRRVNGGEAATP